MDAGGERERLHAAGEHGVQAVWTCGRSSEDHHRCGAWDYFEVDSEVPVAPFPTTHRELQSDELETRR